MRCLLLQWKILLLILYVICQRLSHGSPAEETTTDKGADDGNPETSDGHSNSIIRFSYDDNSDLGPYSWDNLDRVRDALEDPDDPDSKPYSRNLCPDGWVTPLNIDTSNVVAPEENTLVEDDKDDSNSQRSLFIFIPHPGVENLEWEFGHPADAYHGLEVRAPQLGTFQIHDRFDYIGQGLDMGWTGINEFTNYDFSYASIFYCDPDKAGPDRSMHQIDGKRFPLEIDFIFFNQPAKIGYENFVCQDKQNGDCFTVGVMLAILGEFGIEDNLRLQPLIDAAAEYNGPDFGADDMEEDYVIPIKRPWSPTWLIPDTSDYYYYDEGSFPVPPCWPITRIYVIKERIQISRKQLNTLANVRTKREPTTGGLMPCTYSLIQTQPSEDAQEIKYNQYPYEIVGSDNRPMSKEDSQRKAAREKATADSQRKLNARRGIFDENYATSLLSCNYQFNILIAFIFVILINDIQSVKS